MAAAEGDVTKVTRLLASGADPNIEFEGTSALCAAAGEGHSVVVSLLIKHGANVNHHETRPPLSAAVEGGHAYVVSILLQHGADYTVVDRSTGYTPMQVAQIKGYGDIKRLLVAAGATK
jgi:ankyrin repeat protein